ncbi:MAG: hypothetical protein JW856_01360 [Dehalococcoidales bacterium]|nr:hypothetical protein [Dehalococcoidales bacterium]
MNRVRKAITGGEEGTTFVETLVALVILSTVALAFLSGLATITKAGAITDTQSTAESLALSQMEYVKQCTYQVNVTQYPVDPELTVPSEWEVLPASVQPVHVTDDGLQEITVSVQYHDRTVLSMKGYKANR